MARAVRKYLANILESVSTVAQGMWVTLKTAFSQRKLTVQYPSHDIMSGENLDSDLEGQGGLKALFEPALGASQAYKGDLRPRISERYRGMLEMDDPKCIGCLMCALTCPIDVISIQVVKLPDRKAKAPAEYSINYAKCMYCGLCVEVCPTQAVYFTPAYEGATFNFHDLIKEFISPEERERRLAEAAQYKKALAAEKAAKAKEQAKAKQEAQAEQT